MGRVVGLGWYHQTDPRGCALYILRPGDVPDKWSVWCRDDSLPSGEPGPYVRATSQTFRDKADALAYANTVAVSRAPELRKVSADPSAYYSRGFAVYR